MKFAVVVSFVSLLLPVTAAFGQTPSPSPAPAVFEKKDAQGRLVSRVTFRADGTLSHFAKVYGPEAETLTVEEDLDPRREPIRRFREQVDRRGRPVERDETTFAQGRSVTRKTKFTYDAQGRQSAETQVIE